MSTRQLEPFEDHLADLLRESGYAAPHLDLDTATVIGEGSRIVRRRRVLTGVSALAAATVLSIGGYAVLTGGAPLADDLAPASPSVTQVVEQGVVTANLILTSFVEENGTIGTTGVNPLVLDVRYDTSASADNITVEAVDDAQGKPRFVAGTGSFEPTAGVWRLDLPDLAIVVTIEPLSQWSTVVSGPQVSPGASMTSASDRLGDTGYQVSAYRYSRAEAIDQIAGFLRGGSDGAVYDERGDLVDSAQISDGRQWYLSERLDTFGYRDPERGTSSTWLDAGTRGERLVLATGRGDEAGDSWVLDLALLVQAGTTEASVLAAGPDGADVPMNIVPINDTTEVLAASYASATGEMGSAVVQWTDGDGIVHLYSGDTAQTFDGRVQTAAETLSDGTARVFVHQQHPEGALLPVGTMDLAPDQPGAWMTNDVGEVFGLVRGEPQFVTTIVEGEGTDQREQQPIRIGEDLWLVTILRADGIESLDIIGVEWAGPDDIPHTLKLPAFP